MIKNRFPALVAGICMVVFTGLSCSKSNNSYSSTASGISMYNMAFSPATKTVTVGTVVKWTNNDGYPHTVTSNDGTSFSSGSIAGGGTYSYTASVPGTFNYYCTIHGPAMSGTLIVTP